MQTHLSHMQINVHPANLGFYKDLLTFLGWQIIHEDEAMLGMVSRGPALWFSGYGLKEAGNDYDGVGMNHLGIGTATQADVDAMCDYLREKGIALLFETPRHRPEFSAGETHTYYQVMFESPDRVLIEVVYEGPKDA